MRICLLEEVGEAGKEIKLDGANGPEWLMLFHRDGVLSAWRNVCPHQGRPLNFAPDKFLFDPNGRLVCAHHGACFNLEDGECLEGPCKGARLTAVNAHIEDGWVCLREPQ